MSDEKKKVKGEVAVRVSKKAKAVIDTYADEKNITAVEAADKLVLVAWGRIQAVRKDERRRRAGKPTQKAKTKAAKKSHANGVASHAN